MKNPMLEKTVLKILNRVETGLREKTLMAEVEIAMDRPDLTTDEFLDTLRELKSRGLVIGKKTLLGEAVWVISYLGETALKGA